MNVLTAQDRDMALPASSCYYVCCDDLVLRSWISHNVHNRHYSSIVSTTQIGGFAFRHPHFLFYQGRSFYPMQFLVQPLRHSRRDAEYSAKEPFQHFVSTFHRSR